MNHRLLCVALLFVFTAGCASSPDSEYNQGVNAYRSKNYEVARSHWERAVSSGEVLAHNNLGYLLYYGLGGPKDAGRAVKLWQAAAIRGNSESQWHLGHAFEEGKGLLQSNVQAYAWYRCAIVSAEAIEREDESERVIGDDARRSLEKLLPRLTKDEFGEGQSLAREYIEKYAHRSPQA